MKKHDKKVKIKDMIMPIHCVNCGGIGGTLRIQEESERDKSTGRMMDKLYIHERCVR